MTRGSLAISSAGLRLDMDVSSRKHLHLMTSKLARTSRRLLRAFSSIVFAPSLLVSGKSFQDRHTSLSSFLIPMAILSEWDLKLDSHLARSGEGLEGRCQI